MLIEQLRAKIDKIDANIVKAISQRNYLAKQIGQLKLKSKKKIIDKKREEILMENYEKLCNKYQLDHKFIKRLFKLILIHSRRLQYDKKES